MVLTDRVIVLTGCTGQVGAPLARLLAEHNEVHGLARFGDRDVRDSMEGAGIICHPVNLVDPDLSSVPIAVDHMLNFAVTKTGRWDKDLAANAVAAGSLMSHCRAARSVLHCSTTAVYAPNGGEPMSETSALGRDHHQDLLPTYSTTKTAAEAVVRFAATEFGLPTTIARLNVPYGDRFGWPLLHLLMMQADQPIPIHPDGSQYNPIHLDDMLAQLPALLEAATTDTTVLNWSGDEIVSVEEWSAFIGEIAGVEPRFEVDERTIPSAVVDTTKSRPVVGPCAVSWRDGFRRLTEQALAREP
ncbi:MAG: NAD(P)-dependent oxidoreductase [Acidimicrobiia bacterium]|nr:NAD(P)-dependent oxidoreductase [Acidimicrobiia bacterium]